MSDPQALPFESESDDELKLALAAAFGEDAMELLDEDGDETIPTELIFQDIPALHNLDAEDNLDSPRLRWMKKLTASIYQHRFLETPDENSTGENKQLDGRYLTFALGSRSFAFSLATVREVGRVPNITSLPGTPVWLRGVANLRGSIVSVTDFRLWIEDTSPRPQVGEKIIVIQGEDNCLTALSVDRVIGIRDSIDEPIPVSFTPTDNLNSCLLGSLWFAEDEIVVLDANQLLQATQLTCT